MTAPGEFTRARRVLRVRPFRRLFLVLGLSSLGDWVGLLSTSAFAAGQVSGPAAKGVAFGGVIAVRMLPALVLGPLGGIVADRFDRRHTMAVCDTLRFALFASIPTAGLLITAPAAVVAWAALATFGIEAIGMVWSPAKEAAVPNLVPRDQLEVANQLSLATTFGVTPVLGGLFIAGLNALVTSPVLGLTATDLALYFNALTFLANALVVWFGIAELSGHDGRGEAEHRSVLRVLVDGWTYVGRTPLVRGLTSGILVAFAGAGAVIGTALFYARSLGGGDATFDLLFGALFAGFGLGVVTGPIVVHDLSRRRWFSLSIALAGSSVALLAAAPNLAVAVPVCVLAGAGAGMALLTGMTLLGSEVADDLRGRVFAFVQTGCRLALLLTIFASSVLVGVGATARPVLLATGAAMAVGGLLTLRRIDDRPGVPLLRDLRTAVRRRPGKAQEPDDHAGDESGRDQAGCGAGLP
jgi:dTMP kinase